MKRNETLTVNIEPIWFDGLLAVGLVHDHPDVQHHEIVNKNSSDEEVDCKPDFFVQYGIHTRLIATSTSIFYN